MATVSGSICSMPAGTFTASDEAFGNRRALGLFTMKAHIQTRPVTETAAEQECCLPPQPMSRTACECQPAQERYRVPRTSSSTPYASLEGVSMTFLKLANGSPVSGTLTRPPTVSQSRPLASVSSE